MITPVINSDLQAAPTEYIRAITQNRCPVRRQMFADVHPELNDPAVQATVSENRLDCRDRKAYPQAGTAAQQDASRSRNGVESGVELRQGGACNETNDRDRVCAGNDFGCGLGAADPRRHTPQRAERRTWRRRRRRKASRKKAARQERAAARGSGPARFPRKPCRRFRQR